MKHRWMDVVKRGTSALVSSSPRSVGSSPKDGSSTASSSTKGSNNSLSKRRSFALTLPGVSSLGSAEETPEENAMTAMGVAFVHFDERCETVGECSVSKVLDLCMLQGGVHHTHMNILTYLGNPLRIETCCYAMSVQWFRALGDREEFQLIPDACDEWFTPTADDIGAKILAKVVMQDVDAVRTKLLEYGPIKEDPEVRSKVETYLERRSVLFMGLESLSVQDGGENYPNNIDMRESWTLLIDDRRVRLTCESSLLPPFEGFYTSSIRVEIVRCSPHEFYLFLADNCYVHLRAESNTARDIIVLTLRAFCRSAVSSELINNAIAKGISPMLTIRTLAAAEQQQPQSTGNGGGVTQSELSYSLPWNRPNVATGAILIDEDNSDEDDGDGSSDLASESDVTRLRAGSESLSVTSSDFYNDSVLQDAEALIGNGMKMGLQNHLLLPKAPKRISVADIPDLHIIEVMENNGDDANPADASSRQRRLPNKSNDDGDNEGRWSLRDSRPSLNASESVGEEIAIEELDQLNEEALNEAIDKFQREEFKEVETLRSQYVAIFCELQRELSVFKSRAKKLADRLDEKTEENDSFRSDIAMLQDALSSVKFAESVREAVTKDIQQAASSRPAKPQSRQANLF